MPTGNWKCPLNPCSWDADPGHSNGQARLGFLAHLEREHGVPKRNDAELFENYDPSIKGYRVEHGAPTNIIEAHKAELDKYIKLAMEWPESGQGDGLVEKTKQTAVGRGLAIAIWLDHGGPSVSNPYPDADAVIREAVQRYQATRQPVTAEPAQPVSGPATAASVQGPPVLAPVPVPAPEQQAAPEPEPEPEPEQQAAQEPAQDSDGATDPRQNPEWRERITGALSSGFQPEQLATMFNVTVADIESCRTAAV